MTEEEFMNEIERKTVMSRRGFMGAVGVAGLAAGLTLSGCSSTGTTATTEEGATSDETAEEEVDNTVTYDDIDIEEATADEVNAIISGSDTSTLLVDARPQEAYSGWALEGAKNGGHLKGALLFSARWLDCEYASETPRATYLDRDMEAQGITESSTVIVYDYTGKQAPEVAKYMFSKGVTNIKTFKAAELIDAGANLESYENYKMFVPPVLVKSVSDVKTGKESALSAEAAEVFGNDVDNIVLLDVSWGNKDQSGYFSTGHVPGAIHMNTDCYERPRVYVPEKRSEYAKEWRMLSVEEFRDMVLDYGITKDSKVIITSYYSMKARCAWMLRCLGVDVYIMTGSLIGWMYEGYELDTDPESLVIPTSVDSFGTDEIPNRDAILYMDDIKAILAGEREGQVIDNRGQEEWEGMHSGYSYHDLAGQIEGSIHCQEDGAEIGDMFSSADKAPRTQEMYKAYMESCGVDTTKTCAFFCGDSGGAAAIAWFCQSTDLTNVKQWVNGWIPWSNLGNDFIDHNGIKCHYDKWLDTVVDEDGNDIRDGINILDDEAAE